MVFDDLDGRGDGETPAGPREGIALLELSINLRGRDLLVPRWPLIDIDMQVPHDVERGCNVDFVVSNDRCIAIDVCKRGHFIDSLAMFVIEDVDPAVRLRHVDDSAAIDDHVFGLMDKFAWDRSDALFGVVRDVVGVDVWITRIA